MTAQALSALAALTVPAMLSVGSVTAPPAAVRFVAHTIATGLTQGYQVVVADLNRDTRPDVIALDSGSDRLQWYENPGWTPHVLTTGIRSPINAAVHDVDGDGIPEIALAHGFAMVYANSPGVVSVLTHGRDPAAAWSAREIDRLPTSHRLRFMDLDGRGTMVLVNAPLIGAQARAPEYRDRVPLVMYRPATWQRESIDEDDQGVVHGIGVFPWNGDTRPSLLSAGFSGVHVRRFDNGRWSRTRIAVGSPESWPRSGSSEVVVGQLGSERFVATIEPWHGHTVAVYRQTNGEWLREVLDESIEDGHTLVIGDVDADGRDEIIAGERKGRRAVYMYRLDTDRGRTWTRSVIDDGGMAAAGCAMADLNGDARPDVVCVGTSSSNVKWYENRP
jgi:hypothetical protein